MEAKYRRQRKIGEGTYAVVYLGHEIATGRIVAMKKIKVSAMDMGLDISAIREVKLLREIHHPNVIDLIDLSASKSSLTLILEYLTSDLEILIKDKTIVFSRADIKSWMLQFLSGLKHIHSRFILHRDLKPNNLLIAPNGMLKIADFGLARDFANPMISMTPTVVTRWYRAPELLFGAKYYTTSIDMWSVGCILAELMLRTPYLAGETDLSQIDMMFRALGPPRVSDWPGLAHLPDYKAFAAGSDIPQPPSNHMELLFTAAGPHELNLLRKLLTYNPDRRPSAKECLNHIYFHSDPSPTPPERLPKKQSSKTIQHVADNLKRPLVVDESKDTNPKLKIARRLQFS